MKVTSEEVVKLKQQDGVTQKRVFQLMFPSMFRVCLRYLGRIDEAEDCVMKGFMKAFNQLNKFNYENDHSFGNWLKQIIVNESLMVLRKQYNLSLVSLDEAEEVIIEDSLLLKLEAGYLFDAIAKLPVGYRTVLNLFVIEGYSHQEIASILSITESTSKSQLSKAKQKLKLYITQNEYQNGIG